MLFNSFVFVVFFAVVYAAYLLLRNRLRPQNLLLLAASLLFYGWWDWRFLSLLLFSMTLDWFIGLRMERAEGTARRRLLIISLVSNLGVLGFFKYFNFFADSFVAVATTVGLTPSAIDLNIILPMGISFYTFQSLSYTVDVYRRELPACRSWHDFALFVSFFPQLVAGPIERATSLLPQVQRLRTITTAGVHSALWLLAWGYFKKTVVADNLSPIADAAFDPSSTATGPAMWLGVIAFAFQIYADFSGYSDIARGLARLMGFELMINFRCPFLATNPSDFWRRWHISLSSWLRDYLYIPLGGNRRGPARNYANLLITMVLGGLWHGARWNFVLWGLYHGSLLAIHRWAGIHWPGAGAWLPWQCRLAITLPSMFVLTLIGWILFRCQDGAHIASVLTRCLQAPGDQAWVTLPVVAACVIPVVAVDILHQYSRDSLVMLRWRPMAQAAVLAGLIVAIGIFGVREVREFIYFQF